MAGASFRGGVLRGARQRAGLTQVELADRAGVRDAGRIGIWERGQDQPAPSVIPRLAAVLGLEPADFYEQPSSGITFDVLRRTHGLSLMALGERSGLGYKRVRRLEKGLQVPTDDDVDRLTEALGTSRAQIQRAAQNAAATRNPRASAGP